METKSLVLTYDTSRINEMTATLVFDIYSKEQEDYIIDQLNKEDFSKKSFLDKYRINIKNISWGDGEECISFIRGVTEVTSKTHYVDENIDEFLDENI